MTMIISFDDLERLIHAFIFFSRIDYCNSLCIGLDHCFLRCLQIEPNWNTWLMFWPPYTGFTSRYMCVFKTLNGPEIIKWAAAWCLQIQNCLDWHQHVWHSITPMFWQKLVMDYSLTRDYSSVQSVVRRQFSETNQLRLFCVTSDSLLPGFAEWMSGSVL